jgi:hypothetical protein
MWLKLRVDVIRRKRRKIPSMSKKISRWTTAESSRWLGFRSVAATMQLLMFVKGHLGRQNLETLDNSLQMKNDCSCGRRTMGRDSLL